MRSSKSSKRHRRQGAPTLPSRSSRGPQQAPETWLYGLHAVSAALANPRRKLNRALLTARAAQALGPGLLSGVTVEPVEAEAIVRLLPPGAVHQGAALSCDPLPSRGLDEILARSFPPVGRTDLASPTSQEESRRIVLVLDQLSDPHNVGAILRTAAAFGVTCVVVQDRHAPPQSGALAKAASGAIEVVPYVEVVNVARALDKLGKAGFWRVALGS
ncbi:MAG: TrmH family RNA methyltransferase, partial [bacterium]